MASVQKMTLLSLVAALCLGATLAAPMRPRLCRVALTTSPDIPVYSWPNQCQAGETCSRQLTSGRLVLTYCERAQALVASMASIDDFACSIQTIEAGVPGMQPGVICDPGVPCDLGPLVVSTATGEKFLTFCNDPQAPGEPNPFRGVLAKACLIESPGAVGPLLNQPCGGASNCSLGPLVAFYDNSIVEAFFCDVTGVTGNGENSSSSDNDDFSSSNSNSADSSWHGR